MLGEAAGLPTVAALAQLPEDEVAAALDTLSRSEILTDEHHLTFVHPLVRDAVYDDLPAGERALHHERAAQLLRQQGAAPEQVAAHLLRAPRRGSAATVELLRAAARTAMTRGRVGRRCRAPAAGAGGAGAGPRPRRRARRARPASRPSSTGPRAPPTSPRPTPLLDDDRTSAPASAMVIARTHVFVSPPGVATEFARAGGSGRARPSSTTSGRAWSRCSASPGFMHGLPAERYRAGPVPEVSGEGDGARMLAATLGYELLRDGEDRAGAVELARFALEGDRLLAVDNGLLWIVAANVLLLADEDLGDFWDRALARAHATGGLFAALSVNLWRGFTQWRHGQLDDALQSLADATEQQRMWGISDVTATYAAAFTLGVLLDQGDLDGGERRAWTRRAGCRGSARAAG